MDRMSNERRLALGRCGAPAVTLLAIIAVLPSDPAHGAEFVIEVTGSPAIEFRGNCDVVASDGKHERTEFSGTIPQSFSIEAAAVSCVVQKWDQMGRLNATLLSDDEVIAENTTAAAYNWVVLRSPGPWGPARAQRGTQPTVVIQKKPPSGAGPP